MVYNNAPDNQRLVVFSDGAQEIHSEAGNMSDFNRLNIISEQFHLVKKFKELGGVAFKGGKFRDESIDAIKLPLGSGNVDGGIGFMSDIDSNKINDAKQIEKLLII
jgi:hypothetical protein